MSSVRQQALMGTVACISLRPTRLQRGEVTKANAKAARLRADEELKFRLPPR